MGSTHPLSDMPDTRTMKSTGPEPSLHLPKRIRRVRCPRCGSMETAQYFYGLPGPELYEGTRATLGDYIIGGCCIRCVPGMMGDIEINPRYRCRACKRDFGSTAKYRVKGTKDLFDTCTDGAYMVRFRSSGYGGPTYEIELALERVSLLYSPITGSASLDNGVEGIDGALIKTLPLDDKRFRHVIRSLFTRLHVGDWKKRYWDPNILDGNQWELRIDLLWAARPLVIYGSNDYPPNYRRLLRLFRPFFRENGVPYPDF